MPRFVGGESSYASPELALVDAVLAAELRRSLRLVEDSWVTPRVPLEEVPTAIEEDEPTQQDLGDVLVVAALREVKVSGDDDYIVEAIDDDYMVELIADTAPPQHANPHYPVLPSPRSGEEAIEETDAALRQIRERMVDEPSPRKTRLRRRFTVASGASVVFAVGVLAVDVQLHVAQLPGWLRL